MNTDDEQPQDSGASWRWIAAGLILGLLLWGRAAPSGQSYSGGQATTGAGAYSGDYADTQTPRYEPGTYGAFWEDEAAARHGEPARASPGIRPEPRWAGGEDDETQRLREEVERLRAENEMLRR